MAVGQEGALGKGIVAPQVIGRWSMDQLRICIYRDVLLAFLVFVGHFAVPCLNAILLHGKGSIHIMQLEVEATGIAHGLAIGVASPQGCGAGVTVGTLSSSTLADDQSLLWTDERPVLAVHFVVQSASIAEVVAGTISPPERGGSCTTVNTLSSLWWRQTHLVAQFGGVG